MRFRRQKSKKDWLWGAFAVTFISFLVGGTIWTVDRYVPPQHLFWKPLDTSRPLGFATKRQLMNLNFLPSKSCMKLITETEGFKTVVADPKRPTSGAGKGVCGWDVAQVVYGTEDILFAPGESNMQCPLAVAVYLWQREVDPLRRLRVISCHAIARL